MVTYIEKKKIPFTPKVEDFGKTIYIYIYS